MNCLRSLSPAGLFLLFLTLFVCSCATSNTTASRRTFRVMTYNIHHGEGRDGKVDLLRIAELIKREGADIVALQEVDKGVARTQKRDLPGELATLTGLTCVFSNNFHYQGGDYGNAVLTRFPIGTWTNIHYQMLRPGEQRGILQLTLCLHGRKLAFLATHIDYRADDSERLLNVQQIATMVKQQTGMPTILCGDFNDAPGSRTHSRTKEILDDTWEMIGAGEGFTYSAEKPHKRIDYIWISKDKSVQPLKIWVPQSEASDHLPVVAEFELR